MSTGNIGRSKILVNAENQQEMIDKLEKQEERQRKKLLNKYNAKSDKELEDITKNRIKSRFDRNQSANFKPIKDHTIIKDPTSDGVMRTKDAVRSFLSQKFRTDSSPQ